MARAASALSLAALFVAAVATSGLGQAAAGLSAEHGLELAGAGSILSLSFLGYAALALAAGLVSDALGGLVAMGAAVAALAAALLAAAAAPGPSWAAAALFLVAGLGGAAEGTASAVASEGEARGRASRQNAAQLAFGLGAVAGPLLAGAFAARPSPWRAGLAAAGSAALPVGIAALALSRRAAPVAAGGLDRGDVMRTRSLAPGGAPGAVPRRFARGAALAGFGALLRDGRFLAAMLCIALYSGAEVGVWAWLPALLASEGRAPAEAGLASALFWAGMSAGRLACARLSRRFRAGRTGAVLALTASLIASSRLLAASPVAATAAALGLALSGVWPAIVAVGAGRREASPGAALALLVAAGGLGGAALSRVMAAAAAAGMGQLVLGLPAAALALVAMTLPAIEGARGGERRNNEGGSR